MKEKKRRGKKEKVIMQYYILFRITASIIQREYVHSIYFPLKNLNC